MRSVSFEILEELFRRGERRSRLNRNDPSRYRYTGKIHYSDDDGGGICGVKRPKVVTPDPLRVNCSECRIIIGLAVPRNRKSKRRSFEF